MIEIDVGTQDIIKTRFKNQFLNKARLHILKQTATWVMRYVCNNLPMSRTHHTILLCESTHLKSSLYLIHILESNLVTTVANALICRNVLFLKEYTTFKATVTALVF